VMIVGPREPGAIQRWLLGPMAVRVMQRSSCPILVPRGDHPPTETPRLLLGLDAHDAGIKHMVEFGRVWSERLNGKVDAVYALTVALPPIQNKTFRESAERDYLNSQEPERQLLVKALEAVPDAHRGNAMLGLGEPENLLVHLSANYDMVMVGNRGRTGITRILLGNVANHVVRTAHCDVLVLPTAVMFET
jgi:nucleotide-binding universal stress UspA family protein